MNRYLWLVIPLFCIACSESSKNTADDSQMQNTSNETITTEQAEHQPALITKEITYEVDGETFTGFLAYDDNIEGNQPGVLVVHEWWGHNDYARSRARQLAEMGYTAFSLDMYGSGKVTDHPDNAMEFMQAAMSKPDQVKARFLKAIEVLQEQGPTNTDQIAAIGYCFGGGVVLNMARIGVDLDGVASFHGSLAPVTAATPGSVKAKVLVLHGAADAMVPPEQVDAFKAEMETAGADYEFVSYPEVLHSFTNPKATEVGQQYNMPLAYNAEADQDSWKKLGMFLAGLWTEE